MNAFPKCHYCNEVYMNHDTECPNCGALLNGAKPNKKLLILFLYIGIIFAFITLWVGVTLLLTS